MKRLWFSARRTAARTIAVPAVDRVVAQVEDLQVTAIDRPVFRDGAEAMRTEVLRILAGEPEFADDGCHPVWHELGVHAPVGDARSVAP
ncbi:hypothetical protein [Pimelobacter simplex]|uniref:hypothetical protein n=1 Tax=Nocardioides simplex TaxID=2045 RepID=UPI0021505358|nr:hypothetical protein [Pimelobacter simplex]UUW88439.1 hypothetical protein M0M43_22230 [Pimelobacter simplex]UUW97943.1 hypothetical protein M0M48_10875 [Pimelobacter simplex]